MEDKKTTTEQPAQGQKVQSDVAYVSLSYGRFEAQKHSILDFGEKIGPPVELPFSAGDVFLWNEKSQEYQIRGNVYPGIPDDVAHNLPEKDFVKVDVVSGAAVISEELRFKINKAQVDKAIYDKAKTGGSTLVDMLKKLDDAVNKGLDNGSAILRQSEWRKERVAALQKAIDTGTYPEDAKSEMMDEVKKHQAWIKKRELSGEEDKGILNFIAGMFEAASKKG